VTRRDAERFADILDAIETIRSHLRRGDLSDGVVYDAVRVRLIEIGEAAKSTPAAVVATEPGVPWRDIAAMRDRLAHRYFDTLHSIVQSTVENDLLQLEQAVVRLRTTTRSGDAP
jgi:uncharacterized protein with HEPN domain